MLFVKSGVIMRHKTTLYKGNRQAEANKQGQAHPRSREIQRRIKQEERKAWKDYEAAKNHG